MISIQYEKYINLHAPNEPIDTLTTKHFDFDFSKILKKFNFVLSTVYFGSTVRTTFVYFNTQGDIH
jgi:hypothetical protein